MRLRRLNHLLLPFLIFVLCAFSPVESLVKSTVSPATPLVAEEAASASYLDSVHSGAVMDIDATIEASYDGSSQTWTNLISSTGTAYDWWLGDDGTAAAQDPSFTGTAGDPAAYFAPDGGDRCALKNSSSATVLNQIQRTDGTGSEWTFIVAFRTPSSHSGTKALIGGSWTTDNGFYVFVGGGAGPLRFWSADGSSSNNYTHGNLSTDTDYLLVISADMQETTNNITHYLNTTSGTTISYDGPDSTADEANGVLLMASSDAGSPKGALTSGYRIYAYGLIEGTSTAAQVADIFDMYETRHSRDYTP